MRLWVSYILFYLFYFKIFINFLEISKIKTFDNIKKEHKTDEIKFESIKEYSEKIAKELLDQVERVNMNEKKSQARIQKKFNR